MSSKDITIWKAIQIPGQKGKRHQPPEEEDGEANPVPERTVQIKLSMKGSMT
jgi:hypothetical protein